TESSARKCCPNRLRAWCALTEGPCCRCARPPQGRCRGSKVLLQAIDAFEAVVDVGAVAQLVEPFLEGRTGAALEQHLPGLHALELLGHVLRAARLDLD